MVGGYVDKSLINFICKIMYFNFYFIWFVVCIVSCLFFFGRDWQGVIFLFSFGFYDMVFIKCLGKVQIQLKVLEKMQSISFGFFIFLC